LWIAVKLLIMPLVMGLGYEFIKYAGCHDNILVKILSAPGLWMQRITTAEPTDDMIEVGIAAINAVIEHPESEPKSETKTDCKETSALAQEDTDASGDDEQK
ncbi:MAG: DUF1385 domain-containing protein, partial [Acutalibacteraceae bacterium]